MAKVPSLADSFLGIEIAYHADDTRDRIEHLHDIVSGDKLPIDHKIVRLEALSKMVIANLECLKILLELEKKSAE